jgi:hypothetical protein
MNARVHHRRLARQKEQKRNWVPYALMMVGIILLGAALTVNLFDPPQAAASLAFQPGDVAHERPILAVHEMSEGRPIPFLPRNQTQPKIEVPEKSFNFGLVGPYDVVEKEFIIRNTGEAPLTISRAYTTCGCTTAEISASVIPPGKVATVKLIFDAGYHDTSGQTVRRGLIIENNDPQRSQTEIWVQASVRSN